MSGLIVNKFRGDAGLLGDALNYTQRHTRKGLVPKDKVCGICDLEPAFDRLADTVRKSLDMTKIYQWMGLYNH